MPTQHFMTCFTLVALGAVSILHTLLGGVGSRHSWFERVQLGRAGLLSCLDCAADEKIEGLTRRPEPVTREALVDSDAADLPRGHQCRAGRTGEFVPIVFQLLWPKSDAAGGTESRVARAARITLGADQAVFTWLADDLGPAVLTGFRVAWDSGAAGAAARNLGVLGLKRMIVDFFPAATRNGLRIYVCDVVLGMAIWAGDQAH